MGFSFDIAGGQFDGARDYQEDAFLVTRLGDQDTTGSLVIVADGMGGHAAGNVASNLAVQAFNRHVSANFPSDDLPRVLQEGVLKANAAIAETVRETPALKGMGCTLVCAVLADRHLRWVSVGDSNLYLLRDRQLKKKNADHSYGGFLDRMAAEGRAVEPEPGFSRNMLMSALTGDEIADIDCPETPLELQPGDRIIIASDGLDTLSDGKIVYISEASPTARECVDNLLKGVEEENIPRQDNTTVVVVDVLEPGGKRAEPAPEIEEITLGSEETEDRTEPKGRLTVPPPEPEEPPPAPRRSVALVAVIAALAIAAAAAAWYFVAGREPAPPIEVEPPVPEPATPFEEPAAPVPPPAPEAPAPGEPAERPATAPVDERAEPSPRAPATGEGFRDALKSGGQGPEMVWLSGGTFVMGSPYLSAEQDEKPPHEVTVRPFAISRYEVIFAEYERFARATGRPVPDHRYVDKDTHPVFSVTWDDALYYTRWLSQQTGHTYRLPTEAEWEFAARGGTTTAYWWGMQPDRGRAHCFGCESGLDPRKPTRVGSFDPNPFGLYDTAGNVAEWVHDCYHPSYEGAPADGSVWEGGDCSVRVVRGGSFASVPKSLRSSARDKYKANVPLDSIGLRVVREP